MSDNPAPEERNSTTPIATHMAETAWRVAVPFFVFSLGGIWLDAQLESEPLFTLTGITVALVLISVIVYRYVKKHFPESFTQGDDL